jgi:hypothetical protein
MIPKSDKYFYGVTFVTKVLQLFFENSIVGLGNSDFLRTGICKFQSRIENHSRRLSHKLYDIKCQLRLLSISFSEAGSAV